MYIPAAIHLYLVTSDPMLLDSVRVLGSDGEEEVTVERARAYIPPRGVLDTVPELEYTPGS